jgi:hypothetical protein
VIAYASVARMSFSMCSAAEITKGSFDPVEFGRSCERIAREQTDRYRIQYIEFPRHVRRHRLLKEIKPTAGGGLDPLPVFFLRGSR